MNVDEGQYIYLGAADKAVHNFYQNNWSDW